MNQPETTMEDSTDSTKEKNRTPTRFIYYYEGNVGELTPTEKAHLGTFILGMHEPDMSVEADENTEQLRHIETIEEPSDFYDFKGEFDGIENPENFSYTDTTENGVVTLDTFC
jgi:hypothetical protein